MNTKSTKSAGCLIINEDGNFLVFKRGDPLNDFSFPKGKIKVGETPKQAAIRETVEETGLKVQIIKKLGVVKYDYYWEPTDTQVKKSVVYFLAEKISGELDKSLNKDDYLEDIIWVTQEELSKYFKDKHGLKDIFYKI